MCALSNDYLVNCIKLGICREWDGDSHGCAARRPNFAWDDLKNHRWAYYSTC